MLIRTVQGPVTDAETGKVFDYILYYDDANESLLTPGSSRSKVYAGGGNDRFLLQNNNDWGNGESGNDYFEGGYGSDTLYGGIGDDELRGNGEKDYLYGGEGSDTLYGSGNSSVTRDGYDGGNYLEGNEGDDTFYGHGEDTLVGGSGNDIYIIDDTTDIITEYANEGTETVKSSVSYTLGVNLEFLNLEGDSVIDGTGNTLNNFISGNNANNILKGKAGDDQLFGGGGDDSLFGEAGNDFLYDSYGNDTLAGGVDNDTYHVGFYGEATPPDLIVENLNEGTDTVEAYVNYTLGANLENLTLKSSAISGIGNSLNNVISGNNNNNLLEGRGGADMISGGFGDDTLRGEDGNDSYLAGGPGNDFIYGGAGNDNLIGATNLDYLEGGSGNDTYEVWSNISGSDIATVVEFANGGIDTVKSYTSYTLNNNVENLELLDWGSVDIYTATGNDLANTIRGSAANNSLVGAAGNDTLIGFGGIDTLIGGIGNDSLIGGAGADRLTGNAGKDCFVFTSKTEGKDIITDFSVVDDTIYVSKAGFGGGLTAGAVVTAAQFRLGAAADDSSDRFIYNKSTGGLFFDIDGKGGIGQVQFATLSTNLALTNNDISVIA